MQMTIYMLLTSDLRYLAWLEQIDWKHLKRKNKRINFNKNLLVHFLTIFVEIDLAFRKSDDKVLMWPTFLKKKTVSSDSFDQKFKRETLMGNDR